MDFFILWMMISYGQRQLRDLSFSSRKEWLLADGDGGFACSSICFMNTRREHSLLTVSTNLPLRRLTMLNKVDEEIIIDGRSYFLATNHYPDTIFPEGYKLLSRFTFDYFPQMTFDLDGCQLTKKVVMPKRSSSIYIHYENNSRKKAIVRLLPLLSFRPKDSLKKADDGFLVDELPDGVRIISDMNLPRLYLKLSQIYSTSPESYWYYNFVYDHDAEIYEDDREDLYNIGYWETELEPGKGMTFVASTRDLAEFDYAEIEAHCIESMESTRGRAGLPTKYSRVADIAANHIVRNKALRTPGIIEGYPYGAISIKETMMSLDGISKVVENSNYDNDFLYELAANEVGGAFPSRLDEVSLHVEYDDPQVPLYFAIALSRCAEKSKNPDCVRRFLPILEGAIETINESNMGGKKLKALGLLEIDNGTGDQLRQTASNAAANALWFNLLTLVEEARSGTADSSGYSELISEIEQSYFGHYFDEEGNYRGVADSNQLLSDMVVPMIVRYSPLSELQKTKICKAMASRFIHGFDSGAQPPASDSSCNLAIVYLAEATGDLKECAEEFNLLKGILEKLFTGQAYTDCLNGFPKCWSQTKSADPQNISSSVMAGEAIRLIKKFKLK